MLGSLLPQAKSVAALKAALNAVGLLSVSNLSYCGGFRVSVIPFTPVAPPGPAILAAHDYLALPRRPQRWVVEGLLPSGGWLLIHGAPKSGKSFAIFDLAVGVASGQPAWLSFPLKTQGPVVYLQLDTPRGEWAARLESIRDGGEDISNIYTLDKEVVPGFNLYDPATHQWLTAWMAFIRPVLVIVDTYRKVHKGKENASEDTEALLTLVEAACLPAAMVLIHHSKRASNNPKATKEEKEDPIENLRGSGALAGAVDTVMYLKGSKLIYTGRSIADGFVKLQRLPNHRWGVGNDVEALVREVCGTTVGSDRVKAQVVLSRLPAGHGLGEESIRHKIRRLEGRE